MTTKAKSLDAFMKARMAQIDEAHLDPVERADLVNSFFFHALELHEPKDVLEQPLYWDLICFCFGMLSRHTVLLEDENLLLAVKHVNNFMYSLHYSGALGEEAFLGPDREAHEKIWAERIESVMKDELNTTIEKRLEEPNGL